MCLRSVREAAPSCKTSVRLLKRKETPFIKRQFMSGYTDKRCKSMRTVRRPSVVKTGHFHIERKVTQIQSIMIPTQSHDTLQRLADHLCRSSNLDRTTVNVFTTEVLKSAKNLKHESETHDLNSCDKKLKDLRSNLRRMREATSENRRQKTCWLITEDERKKC